MEFCLDLELFNSEFPSIVLKLMLYFTPFVNSIKHLIYSLLSARKLRDEITKQPSNYV